MLPHLPSVVLHSSHCFLSGCLVILSSVPIQLFYIKLKQLSLPILAYTHSSRYNIVLRGFHTEIGIEHVFQSPEFNWIKASEVAF